MTKARDISSLIGSSGQIDNTKITLDANEIPALDTGLKLRQELLQTQMN